MEINIVVVLTRMMKRAKQLVALAKG